MKKILSILILVVFIVIPVAVLIAGQCGLLRGQRPGDLGVHNHMLKAPGETSQNVVTSQAAMHPHGAHHPIAPLRFSGDAASAFGHLQNVIAASEGATIVTEDADAGYIRAEFQSKYLKFIDDVEFMLDVQKSEIHMRSASRLGRKDFGANRARLEKIRATFGAL
jgi:uncharacterized protein (DUF1499 family)